MRSFRTALSVALPLAMPLATLLLAAPAAAAAPAQPAAQQPSVKDGFDAWQRGDYQRAVAIWRPHALAGDPDAQFDLGQAYKLGRGVPTDLDQAQQWYSRAAKQGHLQAEDNLGLVLFTMGRRDEAMTYIAHSAARGEPRAQYVLGTAHFNGDLAAKDWPRAYALTKRASDAGLGIASQRLTQLDGLIPLDQRQAGLAMIPAMEKDEQRARLAAVNAAAPPPPRTAPSPVKTASLPPSLPGTTYTPPPVIAPVPTPAPEPTRPADPKAATATAAAIAATAAANDAVTAPGASAPVRTVPGPLASADIPPATPAAPGAGAGTSYIAPPESGPLPPAAPPKPTPAPVQPTPVQPAPVKAATPKPQPVPPAAVPAAADNWRAQLGAFSVDGNARGLWLALEKKYPALAANQPYLVKSGKLTRLQAGNFATKAEADKFCATVGSASQPCVVMRSK